MSFGRRNPVARARLKTRHSYIRPIGFPGGPNCYRRVLLEDCARLRGCPGERSISGCVRGGGLRAAAMPASLGSDGQDSTATMRYSWCRYAGCCCQVRPDPTEHVANFCADRRPRGPGSRQGIAEAPPDRARPGKRRDEMVERAGAVSPLRSHGNGFAASAAVQEKILSTLTSPASAARISPCMKWNRSLVVRLQGLRGFGTPAADSASAPWISDDSAVPRTETTSNSSVTFVMPATSARSAEVVDLPAPLAPDRTMNQATAIVGSRVQHDPFESVQNLGATNEDSARAAGEARRGRHEGELT